MFDSTFAKNIILQYMPSQEDFPEWLQDQHLLEGDLTLDEGDHWDFFKQLSASLVEEDRPSQVTTYMVHTATRADDAFSPYRFKVKYLADEIGQVLVTMWVPNRAAERPRRAPSDSSESSNASGSESSG